jgi:hypothetical protein
MLKEVVVCWPQNVAPVSERGRPSELHFVRSPPVSFRFLCAVCFVIGLPTLLQAQNYAQQQSPLLRRQMQQQQQQASLQPVEFQGTIQGVAKNAIKVAAENRLLTVTILPITKVHVTGTTTVAALRHGTIVDFVAQIDSHGAIQGKVDALTVTSISQERQLGIYPAGEAKQDNVVDGFAGKSDKDSGESGKHVKRSSHTAKKPAPRTQSAGSYRVIGQLMAGRNGVMSVRAGRGTLAFELSGQAKIDVDMADFSAVSRGNEVSVKGAVVPGQPPTIRASEVHIKLPEPQGGAKPEAAAQPEAKKSSKDGKGEDLSGPSLDPKP